MNKLVAFFIFLLIIFGLVYSSVFVVTEREQAIVTRFRAVDRLATEPGLYFKIPTSFVEDVIFIDDRLLRVDLEDITLQVSDGKFYQVDAFVTYRVDDLQRFLQNVQGANLANAESQLLATLNDALTRVYGLRDFQAALSEERASMMQEVRDQIRPKAENLGLEVVDVRIRRTDLTAEVMERTYERMKAERRAIAAQLVAKGTQEARKIEAIADRKAIEIEATAQREAEIARGEGEAERIKVFAEAFQRDPEFFDFYRSLKAYETAMQDKGSTMILSPDSEFLRYFGKLNPKTQGTVGGQ